MALQGHVELEKLAYLHTHFIPVEQDERSQIEISAEEQVSLFLKSNRTDGRHASMLQFSRSRSLFVPFIHFPSALTMSSSIHGYLFTK